MRKLILLIGPTCTGKSTLEKELNRRGVPSVVSYTTRKPRSSETDGVDYDFLTEADVQLLESQNKVVQKVCFAGNYYGSTTMAIERAFATSDVAVIVVEPTGLTQFKEYADHVGDIEIVSVYIHNDLRLLTTRLVERYESDDNADPAYYWRRFIDMRQQYQDWPRYDSWSVYIAGLDESFHINHAVRKDVHTIETAADHIIASCSR